jgi:hypothetical protein
MQAYYVYENWTRKRSRIHRAECSFCNDGMGVQSADSGNNGMWHGPYTDRALAFKKAESFGYPEIRRCEQCRP